MVERTNQHGWDKGCQDAVTCPRAEQGHRGENHLIPSPVDLGQCRGQREWRLYCVSLRIL